jgi:hypothetical protein
VGGTTGDSSPPPGGGVAIAERESKSTVRNSHALLLRRRRQSVFKVSTINSLSTFVISEMLNGRGISGEDDHLDFLDSKVLMYPNFD